MICGSGGSKSRLAKAAGAEPAGQMRDKELHAVVARSTFRNEDAQNTPFSDHFWQLRCRKSARRCGAKHVASEKGKSTSRSEHFWKLRCRKSARRCGAKHISKSKCTKHLSVGRLLEVEMSKKWAPASLRATPNASLQATSRNHTLLTLWTLTLGNTDFITLGNTANIVLIIIT